MKTKIRKTIVRILFAGIIFSSLAVQAGDIVVTVTIEHLVAAVIQPPADKTAKLSEIVIYDFRIQNLSNVPDSYDLSASSSPDWKPVITTGNTSGYLLPEESILVAIEQTVPADTPADTQNTLTLFAVSQADPTIYSSDSVITTVVSEIGEVEVKIAPKSRKGSPGETVHLKVIVKNKGKLTDTFKLTGFTLSGWPVYFPDGNIIGSIKYNSSKTLRVEVAIPGNAVPGSKNILTVTAVSQSIPAISGSDTAIIEVTGSKKDKKS